MLGTTIGNYKITAEIGHGGMGVVYLAEHPALGRKAAVKVLHARLAANRKRLARGEIEGPIVRPANGVASCVAKRLARVGRNGDARGIEPAGD